MSIVFPHAEIDCQGLDSPSLVNDQPMTEVETRQGAINRVKFCQLEVNADFYVAIEGGVDFFQDGPSTFAYVVIADKNSQSVGRSANLPLPPSIYQSLNEGDELGHVLDKVFNTTNIKQKGGAMSLLTKGHATREGVYTQALILALAPYLHKKLYKD